MIPGSIPCSYSALDPYRIDYLHRGSKLSRDVKYPTDWSKILDIPRHMVSAYARGHTIMVS